MESTFWAELNMTHTKKLLATTKRDCLTNWIQLAAGLFILIFSFEFGKSQYQELKWTDKLVKDPVPSVWRMGI